MTHPASFRSNGNRTWQRVAGQAVLCLALSVSGFTAFHAVSACDADPEFSYSAADLIVEATVQDIRSWWTTNRSGIISRIDLQTEESIRGPASSGQHLQLIVSGGDVDGIVQRNSLTPDFKIGERAVFFLCEGIDPLLGENTIQRYPQSTPMYRLHGHFRGKLTVGEDSIGQEPLSRVNAKRRNGVNDLFLRTGYTDHEQRLPQSVRRPQYVLNDKWAGVSPNVNYRIHSDFDANQQAAVQSAAASWNSAGAHFSLTYAGTHTRSGNASHNGINEIVWYNLGSDSTLAYATWWISGGYIIEADIAFNTQKSFSTTASSGTHDLESVAAHELGHWLSLGHALISSAVMYYQLPAETLKRALHDDDVAGIKALYPDRRIIRLSGNLDFGDVLVNTLQTNALTIHNDGNSPLTVDAISLPEGFSGDWSGSIAPGSSQAVTITFTPTTAQSYGGIITVTADPTDGTPTHPCSGRGAVRILRLTGDLSFGYVPIGSAATKTLTLHNDGNTPLTVNAMMCPEGFAGGWSGTLATNGIRQVTVSFTPTTAGHHDGVIQIDTDQATAPPTHPCSGSAGYISPLLSIQNQRVSSNGVSFHVDGTSGNRFTVETCSNLLSATWQTLATNILISGSDYTFIDRDGTGRTPRFYRISAPVETVHLPAGMTLIPAGTNTGITPDNAPYTVTSDTLYMSQYEITKALWDRVVEWNNGNGYVYDDPVYNEGLHGQGKGPDHPVHTVSWYDCVKWCNARSEMDGRDPVYYMDAGFTAIYKTGWLEEPYVKSSANGYRLPTDEQWEYAARGGVTGGRFPWSDTDTIQHSRANYRSRDYIDFDTSLTRDYHPDFYDGVTPYTSPVGRFAPNGYGLYDMVGNVHEWCYDWLPDNEGTRRVNRGGSWGSDAYACRLSSRGSGAPYFAFPGYGFRVILPLPTSPTP